MAGLLAQVVTRHSPCARGVAHREHGPYHPVADGENFVNDASFKLVFGMLARRPHQLTV
jgi:hypothetical protein